MDYYIRNLYYQLTKLEHPNFKWRQVFPSNEVDLQLSKSIDVKIAELSSLQSTGRAGQDTIQDYGICPWSICPDLTQTCGLIVMLIYGRLINSSV